jgi:hypothetical protein
VSDQVLDHRPDVRSDQKFDHRPLGFVFILHTASLYVSMGLTKPDIAALEALPPQALAQIPGEAPPNSVIPNSGAVVFLLRGGVNLLLPADMDESVLYEALAVG